MIARQRFLIFAELIGSLRSLNVWPERGDIIFTGLSESDCDIDYNEHHQKKVNILNEFVSEEYSLYYTKKS